PCTRKARWFGAPLPESRRRAAWLAPKRSTALLRGLGGCDMRPFLRFASWSATLAACLAVVFGACSSDERRGSTVGASGAPGSGSGGSMAGPLIESGASKTPEGQYLGEPLHGVAARSLLGRPNIDGPRSH